VKGLIGMRPVCSFAFAAIVALALHPANAQTPSSSMPAGTQNPALAQPQLVAPPPVRLMQPAPQPGGPQPGGPTPDSPNAGVLITPGGAGGLCECLNSHNLSASVFDKTKMHQVCLGSVDACQAACNTQYLFSFVPHAIYTCPGRPEEGHVAMNAQPSVRLLSAR
jgi:hypothetical protein